MPNVIENFTYDTLNRLLQVTGTAGPSNAPLIPRTFVYNQIGNILYKSDAGLFTYSASGAGSVRPHAVASVAGPINASYTYDANGSMTAGNGKTLTYTSFNMVNTIASGAYNYTYNYNAEHQRVKLITVRPDDTLTSIYASAGFYEKEISTNTGEVTHKFYVKGVGVHVAKSTGLSEMRYYHTDNLGSIVTISNEVRGVLEQMAYEAFGERRYDSGDPQDRLSPIIGITTDRGYTGHEHLDEMNLVHMNGRVFDPALGVRLKAG